MKPNLERNHAAYATKMIRAWLEKLEQFMNLNWKRGKTESGGTQLRNTRDQNDSSTA